MSTTETNETSGAKENWAAGAVAAAGILLLMAGAWQILMALSALVNDKLFVVGVEYLWKFDLTAWGWIHLVLGALLILTGIFVLRGAAWAAFTGILLAGLSALANFMWLPYQPIWGIVIIALDVLIIWALATRRNALRMVNS
jgi:hypothetical protein